MHEKPTIPTSLVPTGRLPLVETPYSASSSNRSSSATTTWSEEGIAIGSPPNATT